MTASVSANPDLWLVDGRFLQIRQMVGFSRTKSPEAVGFHHDLVEELTANGVRGLLTQGSYQHPHLTAAPAGNAAVYAVWRTGDDARGRTTGPAACRRLDGMSRFSGARGVTIAGLVVGAAGISILWAAGQEFPIYPPPGIVLLLAGALFIALTSWRWTPAVGAVLGAFVTVGTLISPDGLPNLTGESGAAIAVGQAIQAIGVVTALVAGVIATRANYRRVSAPRR